MRVFEIRDDTIAAVGDVCIVEIADNIAEGALRRTEAANSDRLGNGRIRVIILVGNLEERVDRVDLCALACRFEGRDILGLRFRACLDASVPGNFGMIDIEIEAIARAEIGITVVGVVNTLAGQVTKELEEEFLTLVGVTLIPDWRGYSRQRFMESSLCPVCIVLFEQFEADRDIAAVTALGATESSTLVVIIVIDHEANAHSIQRIEHLAQRAAQHIEKHIRPRRAHITLIDQGIALTVVTGCCGKVWPVVDGKHDQRLTARRQARPGVDINVRVIGDRCA